MATVITHLSGRAQEWPQLIGRDSQLFGDHIWNFLLLPVKLLLTSHQAEIQLGGLLNHGQGVARVAGYAIEFCSLAPENGMITPLLILL